MNVGDRVEMKGYVTLERYLINKSLPEIEKRLGYQEGRLSEGAVFLVAERMPQKNEFETKGYSQVPGHKHVPLEGYDKNALSSMAQNAMAEGRIVKVIPKIPHNPDVSNDMQYPPGSGVPQWNITSNIPFKVESVVEKNGKYTGRAQNQGAAKSSAENGNPNSSINNSSTTMDNKNQEIPKDVSQIKSGALSEKFNPAAEKSAAQDNPTGKGSGETKGTEKLGSGSQFTPSMEASPKLKGNTSSNNLETDNQPSQQKTQQPNSENNNNFKPR